jgi:hypothetical protein
VWGNVRREDLTVVFALGSVDVASVLRGLRCVLFASSERDQNLNAALEGVERNADSTFNLISHGYELDFGKLARERFQFLLIRRPVGQNAMSWNDWMQPFLEFTGFMMAWLADTDYQYWQNAYDPLQYRAVEKPFEHLPQKSNGLPYPLEQSIIDISANPGRRLVRKGYYEAVGAVMWLGERFWTLTGADRVVVENAGWLRVSSPNRSVVRVEAATDLFTEDAGPSRDCQEELRVLLFPGAVNV